MRRPVDVPGGLHYKRHMVRSGRVKIKGVARSLVGFALLAVAWAALPAGPPTSRTDPRLAEFLRREPAADANGDGLLTADEVRAFRRDMARAAQMRGRDRGRDRPPEQAAPVPPGRDPGGRAGPAAEVNDGLKVFALDLPDTWHLGALVRRIARGAGVQGHVYDAQAGEPGPLVERWHAPDSRVGRNRIGPALAAGVYDVLTVALSPGDEPDAAAPLLAAARAKNPALRVLVLPPWRGAVTDGDAAFPQAQAWRACRDPVVEWVPFDAVVRRAVAADVGRLLDDAGEPTPACNVLLAYVLYDVLYGELPLDLPNLFGPDGVSDALHDRLQALARAISRADPD